MVDNNVMSPADYAAVTGNNNTWNDGAWWIIILFLFMFMGWGSNGWNQGGPQQNLATSNEVQNGFDHQAVISNLGTINGNVQNGFSNAEISRCNNTASIINGITNAAYANQQGLSDLRYQVATEGAADRTSLQQSLAEISRCNNTASIINGITNAAYANQQGLSDLRYQVATEGAADRTSLQQSLAEIMADNRQQTQSILDRLCQQEIDAKNETIQNLRTQLNMAALSASQNAQTGQLMADNAQQTQNLMNRLNPAPVPAYVVANPNGCNCGTFNGCCGA